MKVIRITLPLPEKLLIILDDRNWKLEIRN